MTVPEIPFEAAPWRLSGTVYGTLLNDRQALAALGDAVHQPPYKAPPRAPVLYLKPRNTLAAPGATVTPDADVSEFELGASIGLVIGRTACAVPEADALSYLSGCTLVLDLFVPHDSFYRPSVRLRARDGSCLLGPRVAAVDPDRLRLDIEVDGRHRQQVAPGGLLRGAARLLAEVSAFMTLRPGDVLMLGVAAGAPRVRAGQHFGVAAEGLGRLQGAMA